MANRTKPFTLDILAPHLKNFTPPQGAFDPEGKWYHIYRVYTLAGRSGWVGTLDLNRRNTEKKNFLLELRYQKYLPGQHTQITIGQLQCQMDELSTPTAWKFACFTWDNHKKKIPNTNLGKFAAVKDDAIVFRDGQTYHRIVKPETYNINWALFDVVQRLPRRKRQTLSFALLDHFDQVKPNQTLTYHGTQEVFINNTTLRLHRFDQLGEGIVPWVYWVDASGRLLFVVSGLEAYILDAASD